MVTIKSKREIELMKEACKVVALTYEKLEKEIKPGMTTFELDQLAEKTMRSLGAVPAEKGYDSGIRGVPKFPASICISINDEVIHGIPSKNRIIKDGDVVSIDTVALKDGFNGDAARTFIVGKASKEAQRLVDVTKQAFFEGIKFAKPGYRIGDISHAIGEYVRSQGYSVVREFQGHGIGQDMHEDPGVPNIGKKGTGPRLQAGMALAIEPMICEGKPDVYVKRDLWTIATVDKKMTSYYENTIVITNDGPKILTLD